VRRLLPHRRSPQRKEKHDGQEKRARPCTKGAVVRRKDPLRLRYRSPSPVVSQSRWRRRTSIR
jgi:hypothetical protein